MSICFRALVRVSVFLSGGLAISNPGQTGLLVLVVGRGKACPISRLPSVWSCYLAAPCTLIGLNSMLTMIW